MKILIIKTYPSEINTSTYNCQETGLALAFRKAGHECDILCVADNGQYHEKEVTEGEYSVKIYCAKALRFKDNAWFIGVDPIFEQYDVLQPGEYNELYTWHLAGGRFAKKVIVYHGPYYSPYMWKYNRMAKIFDCFFLGRYKRRGTPFLTKSRLAEDYLRHKGLENVTTIGVGTVNSLKSNDAETSLSRRIRAAKGAKLLYIGVMDDRRNVMFLLDVLKTLLQRDVPSTLVLIGRFVDEDYKSAFDKAVEEKGLSDNIIYEPVVKQRDIGKVYEACDAFLFPTRYDIYGMVLLEAMQHGLPVISTLCGGSQMLIESGKNGIIITDNKSSTWAEHIHRLVTDSNYCSTMGDTARETILKDFTWDVLSVQFLEIYRIFRLVK